MTRKNEVVSVHELVATMRAEVARGGCDPMASGSDPASRKLNRVFTGIDIWILFKIFIVMPVTVVFFWWQAQLLQKHRQPDPERSRHSG